MISRESRRMKEADKRRLQAEQQVASEALMRKLTAEATVLNNKAMSNDKLRKVADERLSMLNKHAKRHGDMLDAHDRGEVFDMEGTATGLADNLGNYANDARVARAGGIGVKGSNSTESGEPAFEPDKAGYVDPHAGPVAFGHGGRGLTPEDLANDAPTMEPPEKGGKKGK